MGQRSRVKAWLELARISNVPTVWSNALVGVALGWPAVFPWGIWAIVALSCSMLYVAGMIHNDAADAAVDQVERPARPIPSGRVSRQAAGLAAGVLIIAGVHLLWFVGATAVLLAVGLVVLIVAYNLLHRRGAWTVLLMAGCRATVYLIGAAAIAWPIDWCWAGPMAAVLGGYIVLLSMLARREADDRQRVRLVVGMICAISLLDAGFLLILGQPIAAGVAAACFVLAAFMQRRILGT